MSTSLAVVIPTYRREHVLVATVESLLALPHVADELILVDQTPQHQAEVETRLRQFEQAGAIRWLRRDRPGIPGAMNAGLLAARSDAVLFLDDDIAPDANLVAVHREALSQWPCVAGRVIQPWTVRDAPGHQLNKFERREACDIDEFMGGNFSIRKEVLLAAGGFDENFRGVAYCFEKEFADRLRGQGYTIRYRPDALIDHLKEDSGGTRSFGHHLTTIRPHHAVGAHYYLLRSQMVRHRTRCLLRRIVSAVLTRHHVRRPWWIPVTCVAEVWALLWAIGLNLRGPRLIDRGRG